MSLSAIAHDNNNANLSNHRALVVGGTSGIGRAIAIRLAQANASVTIMGRSTASGNETVNALKQANPLGDHDFIATDASLISVVRESCSEYKRKHDRLDILVTCPGGAPNLAGRKETIEGLDSKMVTHYFGRVCFWLELTPLLKQSPSPRILSVHGQTGSYKEYETDFELKQNFSFGRLANACGLYNSIALESISKEHGIFCIHASPGIVQTNWGREFSAPLRLAVRFTQMLISVSPESCAEYMCHPLLSQDKPVDSFFIMGAKAEKLAKLDVHDKASESVWNQTKQVLSRV